jgi:hypothetical protein
MPHETPETDATPTDNIASTPHVGAIVSCDEAGRSEPPLDLAAPLVQEITEVHREGADAAMLGVVCAGTGEGDDRLSGDASLDSSAIDFADISVDSKADDSDNKSHVSNCSISPESLVLIAPIAMRVDVKLSQNSEDTV